jgi:hypothetical protein
MKTVHTSLFLALFLTGCVGATDEPEPAAEAPVTAGQEAIRGGTETTRVGVVNLNLWHPAGTNPGVPARCTGVMVGPQTILTTASCVADYLPAGQKTVSVSDIDVLYKKYDGVHYVAWRGWQLQVTVWPGFHGGADAENDLAVITGGYPWVDTNNLDYAYIFTDTLGAYSRYQLYGYGYDSFGGTGDGVLRQGSMALDWYGSHHMIFSAGGVRVCRGDSGGPAAVYESVSGRELQVIGLASSVELTPSGNCSAEGPNVRYTRLSDKVSWIASVSGSPCVQERSQTTNRLVTRCFRYQTLYRTTRSCATRAALHDETIDLTQGYSNYTCHDRYQEQCINDHSFDFYQTERCE